MAKKTDGFTIRESELAKTLEITPDKLDEIVLFFDSDPNDRWELKENYHFIYFNKSLNERTSFFRAGCLCNRQIY